MATRVLRSRRSWRGGEVKAQKHRLDKRSRFIVHHTAADYDIIAKSSIKDEQEAMRHIQAQHRNRGDGFTDIGYSFVVFPSGRIYVGRGWYRAAAAAQYANAGHIHVSLIGNFEFQKPTTAAVKSARQLYRMHRRRSGNRKPALGHRDANSVARPPSPMNNTLCPGKHLYPKVAKL